MEPKNALPHKGKRLIITGIPTIGKTSLAKRLAEATGGIFVSADDVRHELRPDPKYTDATNFWKNKNKRTYYIKTSYAQQWKNIVSQSEKLWEGMLNKINSYANEEKPVIFEGVSFLPHLVHKDLNIPCMVIAGATLEEVVEKNKDKPVWENTELELQSAAFFLGDQPYFKAEAEKYNYPVFTNNDIAFKEALKILE
ncbi:MAG: AAA family ATPase [Candidatus Paceibacterota bacterium]|jgi:2-phosphoglycerate kinase